jgi:uncharacterized membrane protein
MTSVDVTTSVEIEAPRDRVAAFAADPSNAPHWYVRIVSVELLTPHERQLGAKAAFVARFMGRTLRYVYEIVDDVPGERLVMRTEDGPFPMETTYTWTSTKPDTTLMTLRNRGEPAGFSTFVAPFMQPAMRRANRKDLQALKTLMER